MTIVMVRQRRYRRAGARRTRGNTLVRYNRGGTRNYSVFRKRIIPRGVMLRTHHFKQTFHPPTSSFHIETIALGLTYTADGVLSGLANASATYNAFSYAFHLNDLPQVASFTALFDSYRVNKVVIKFVPMAVMTQSIAGASTAGLAEILVPPVLFTVLDYDDSGYLASENAALEYDTYKQTPARSKHVRVARPKLSLNAFKTAGTTIGYVQQNDKDTWVDLNDTTVEYYWLKGGVLGYPTDNDKQMSANWRVYVTAYFSCRQLR